MPAGRAQTVEPAQSRFDRPIVAGSASDSFPNSYIGNTGRCEGFAVDILDAAARVMDIKIERVVAPGGELHDRFLTGEFDLLQTYSNAPGRERYADFSTQLLNLHGGVFVRKNEPRFQTPTDLNGSNFLMVGRGSIGEKFLRDFKIVPRQITYVSSVADALQLIEDGHYDAVFSSRLTALSMIDRGRLRNLRPLSVSLEGYEVRHCFAVHRGDSVLLARLNEGLAILHRTGEFDEIYRKWYGRFDSPVFTREQVVTYAAVALALGLVAAVFGLLRQRILRKQFTLQSERLVASEALLAEAQKIAQVGHWSYETASRTVTCSEETFRILERNSGLGAPSYARILAMVLPAERSATHRFIRQAVHTGAACEFTISLRPRPDLRKIVHVSVRAERNSESRVQRLFGTIQDITHRITAEKRLRAREQLLRALSENVPIAMGVVEASGNSFHFVSANPSTSVILGLGLAGVADRSLGDLPIAAEIAEFWTRWFREGNQSPEILKTEQRLSGTGNDYAITLVPLSSADSESPPQLCYLIEDITERKQIDAEVAQGRKLRAVGELVGGIAHEFNNLLTPVLLKAEMLADELRREPRLLEELRTITHAAQRGAELTRRLLAFGRQTDVRSEVVELRAAVQANFGLIQPTLDRRIQFTADLPAHLPALYLNSSDLHQVILNLVLNARDTLIEKLERGAPDSWCARIRVHAAPYSTPSFDNFPKNSAHPGWLCLSVEDNGMGMTPDVQERIFEPFYTTKEVGRGTGLGLATVWHAVNRLGGKINVVSRPGEGSTFHVWLPLKPASGQEKPAAAPEDAVNGSRQPSARILLVEDDELVARSLITALRRQRHQVVHFSHGIDAWQHLTTNPDYDLVVLDLDLPGISGLEILRRLRSSRFPGRILVASGRMTDVELRELESLRVEGTLEKPFTMHGLHAAVQASLHNARSA